MGGLVASASCRQAGLTPVAVTTAGARRVKNNSRSASLAKFVYKSVYSSSFHSDLG